MKHIFIGLFLISCTATFYSGETVFNKKLKELEEDFTIFSAIKIKSDDKEFLQKEREELKRILTGFYNLYDNQMKYLNDEFVRFEKEVKKNTYMNLIFGFPINALSFFLPVTNIENKQSHHKNKKWYSKEKERLEGAKRFIKKLKERIEYLDLQKIKEVKNLFSI